MMEKQKNNNQSIMSVLESAFGVRITSALTCALGFATVFALATQFIVHNGTVIIYPRQVTLLMVIMVLFYLPLKIEFDFFIAIGNITALIWSGWMSINVHAGFNLPHFAALLMGLIGVWSLYLWELGFPLDKLIEQKEDDQ